MVLLANAGDNEDGDGKAVGAQLWSCYTDLGVRVFCSNKLTMYVEKQ